MDINLKGVLLAGLSPPVVKYNRNAKNGNRFLGIFAFRAGRDGSRMGGASLRAGSSGAGIPVDNLRKSVIFIIAFPCLSHHPKGLIMPCRFVNLPARACHSPGYSIIRKDIWATVYRVLLSALLLSPAFATDFVVAGPAIDPSLIIFHFHGPDTTANLGSYISALGDINNDGYDDIAVSCYVPLGTYFGTYVFHGGNPVDTFPDYFYPLCIDFQCLADLTGDGITDCVARRFDGSSHSTDRLYFFRGYGDSLATVPYDSLLPETTTAYYGFFRQIGYIDADEYPDLITCEHGIDLAINFYSGCPSIDKELDWCYVLPQTHFVSNLCLIDFNGDDNLDLCAAFRGNIVDTVSYITIFFGPSFSDEPDIKIYPPFDQFGIRRQDFAYTISNIGDFNGDGWDDLGDVYVGDTGGYFPLIYYCGPGADTLPDVKTDMRGSAIAGVGDINHDGYDDLVCGGYNSWEGIIVMYLGGPRGDSIADEYVSSNDLPPLFLDDIGYQISTAGDFNGDGITDFVFACRNFWPVNHDPGDIFVVSGSEEIVVGAHEARPPAIPDKVELRQNFPNPFNSGTTIEFTLPRAGYTELKIYNILGEVVARPCAAYLAAGRHRIAWDGRATGGRPVATGTYVYEVTVDGHSQAKKLIVLK